MRPHRWQPTRLPRPCDSPGKNTGVGCHFLLQCIKGSSESDMSRVRLLETPGLQPTRLLRPWDFPGKCIGVDFHCLLPTKPKVVNFKVLKLSGHLVDLSAAQLHPNIMNATGTNPERRAEKPQHHHSALVPSEYAVGCVSLPRSSSPACSEALLRLKPRQARASPGPSPDGHGRSQTFGASDRRAQAGLETRNGRPPCSPATFPVVTPCEGTRVCGVHTNAEAARRTDGTTGCEDAARPADDRRAWRNDSGRRGAATSLPALVRN